MTVAITLQSRTENTLVLGLTYAGGTQSLQLQYATRFDYQFCIAPIVDFVAASTATMQYLNRAQTYWIRGREIIGGVPGAWSEPKAFTTNEGTPNLPNYQIQISPAQIVIPIRPSAWSGYASVPGYPPSNLGLASPMAAWRAQVAVGAICAIETDGSLIDTIALLETNLPEGAAVRVIGGPTMAHALGSVTPEYYGPFQNFRASENLPGRRGYHALIRSAVPLTHRFLGVQIAGDYPPGGLVHVTHAVFGKMRQIRNYADMTDQPFDLSTSDRMRDGTPDMVPGFRGRRVDFELAGMTESQHEAAFADLALRVGTTDPVLIMPNSKPGAYFHDRMLYGNLTANRQTNSNARFTRSLSIESVIN